MFRKLFILVVILSILAVWLVPKESDYIARIAKDYGSMHSGIQIPQEQLKQMISYQFDHHLFYSEFTCTYGNISVEYHGFFSMIFFVESTNNQELFDIVV
ncbi:hypothetical protein GCM10011506_00180 [Marivirga lumbricoides]|uniref:DUF4359 domain-containing protein n=1 Tax=Marivirga lumbricoides TaxID=1046115 RepID=A0ABQ1L414_9BACT|nr:hypothetical protein GCM10011506_00180 [Marivirga lumbricoides]